VVSQICDKAIAIEIVVFKKKKRQKRAYGLLIAILDLPLPAHNCL
jgi:hypothetical protein